MSSQGEVKSSLIAGTHLFTQLVRAEGFGQNALSRAEKAPSPSTDVKDNSERYPKAVVGCNALKYSKYYADSRRRATSIHEQEHDGVWLAFYGHLDDLHALVKLVIHLELPCEVIAVLVEHTHRLQKRRAIIVLRPAGAEGLRIKHRVWRFAIGKLRASAPGTTA